MAKESLIVVTGRPLLDFRFKRFAKSDRKGARKALRRATKKSTTDIVLQDFKRRVPVKSGTLRDVADVRAIKRSRKKIGSHVYIDRDLLFSEYKLRTGNVPRARRDDVEPFFYPITVEFNTEGKPLRKSLYDNESQVKRTFIRELKKELALAGR